MLSALPDKLLKSALEIERAKARMPHRLDLPDVAKCFNEVFGLPGPVIPSQSWYIPNDKLLVVILEKLNGQVFTDTDSIRTEASKLVERLQAFNLEAATPPQLEEMIVLLCTMHQIILGWLQEKSGRFTRRHLAA
jgi:hypothetical protein